MDYTNEKIYKINYKKQRYIKDNDDYIINLEFKNILKKMDSKYIYEDYITFTELLNLIRKYIKIDNPYDEKKDKKKKYLKILELYENNEELYNIINKGGSGLPNIITKFMLNNLIKRKNKYDSFSDSD